jgi:glycine cleavage system H protein
MEFPANLHYSTEHEWLLLEGDVATIGITDYAQSQLGDIIFVEANTVGETLEANAVFGTVEAVKTVSDLFLPVSGEILELNPALDAAPELVNSEPYTGGWIVKLKVTKPEEIAQLLNVEAYKAYINE